MERASEFLERCIELQLVLVKFILSIGLIVSALAFVIWQLSRLFG